MRIRYICMDIICAVLFAKLFQNIHMYSLFIIVVNYESNNI
jgi:hypothetical protein